MDEPARVEAKRPCMSCGAENPAEARFCAFCGRQVALAEAFARFDEGTEREAADPLVGRILAERYRILSLIGRGGMGVVYKVEHIHIGKLMAMKLLHGELAYDREVVKRFRREAEAASRLSHANTVQIFDFGRSQGLMYLVMEYLSGRDLGAILKQDGPLPFSRVARICAQVCQSVGEAHEQGIIHRDIKPENILLVDARGGRDVVKVCDFGLAKLREQPGTQSITRQGALVGTPYYMAPEQIRGDPMDQRVDIYALGGVIYKALTGLPPFWASTPVGIITKHLTEPVEPPSRRVGELGIPPEADAIVLRAMAKDPQERFTTMSELCDALLSYLTSIGEEPISAVRSGASSFRGSVTAARPETKVATKSDVDKFERRLRRRGWLSYVLWFLLLAAAGAGGSWLYRNRIAPARVTREREPNNTPTEAQPLAAGATLTAMLGKRLARSEGDADVFLLENKGGRRVARLAVSALPNIDIGLDLVRAGAESPVLHADTTGVDGAEVVPNFPLASGVYYLRVREARIPGVVPTENVSDTYTVEWNFFGPAVGDEVEVNDSLDVADSLRVGTPRRGYVGWRGDVDVYCVADPAPAHAARATLTSVPSVDLVLTTLDRVTRRRDVVDRGAVSEPEASAPIAQSDLPTTCFEVSADSSAGAAAGSSEYAYTIELGAADVPDSTPPAGPG